MARTQVQDPLRGAAPTLQPTARPQAVSIGATPEPRRSPLLELANAFADFNPTLRASLRDAAAQADNDALAQGELAAMKASAAARMGELDGLIKQQVDAGKIPAARAPAFTRGFRSRVGQDLAQSVFQDRLLARMPDVTRVANRLDPEQAIADTYAEVSKQIAPDDFYARQAFDASAQGVMAGFRSRAVEGYTAAYKAAGEQTMADTGSELVLHLASSAAEDSPGFLTAVKSHLDAMRQELPTAEVNPFFIQKIVAPAIDKLVSQDKYTDALHLIEEMDGLDVTGKGGLLGQTAVGKDAFARLRAQVEQGSRVSRNEAYTQLVQGRQVSAAKGEDAAGSELLKLRLENSGGLPRDQEYKLIDAFSKANADNPHTVAAYAAAVHQEFANEDKYRADPRVASDFEVKLNTLDPVKLEALSAELDAQYQLGTIAASDRSSFVQRLGKLKTLSGAIDEQDTRQMKLDLYAFNSGVGPRSVNFGDLQATGPTASAQLWDKLPQALQEEHETKVSDYFYQTLQDQIRSIGDPNKIAAEKGKALEKATILTRSYAFGLLRDMSGLKEKAAAAQKVEDQKVALRNAGLTGRFFDPPVFGNYRLPNTGVRGPSEIPPPITGPDPERDQAEVTFPARTIGEWFRPGPAGSTRIVDLRQIAKDIQEQPDLELSQKAKDVYGYVKSRLGFTAEEVLKGVTKHGVPFVASEIDPRHIAVFTSRTELEKEYNSGEPTPKFLAVGDALDPRDAMTPAQFYLAQRALFK